MNAFFSMGGYGAYIWSAFAMTVLALLFEVISIRQQYRKTLQRLNRIQKLNQQHSPGNKS